MWNHYASRAGDDFKQGLHIRVNSKNELFSLTTVVGTITINGYREKKYSQQQLKSIKMIIFYRKNKGYVKRV